MKYKQELLDCYKRKETIEKIKSIISFVEDKEKKYNKDIDEFTVKELHEVFDNIEGYKISIEGIVVSKEDIYYHIFYYIDLVKELEK